MWVLSCSIRLFALWRCHHSNVVQSCVVMVVLCTRIYSRTVDTNWSEVCSVSLRIFKGVEIYYGEVALTA